MSVCGARVLIHGSCVSRDALNERYDAASAFTLVDYLARSSLATSFIPGQVGNVDVEAISSAFQRRMVTSDVEHGLSAILTEDAFDVLVVDLIDERFNLFADDQNALCTISSELLTSGFRVSARRGRVIRSGSAEFFALWGRGWQALLTKLESINCLHKIVVNEVYWSKFCADGKNFLPHDSEEQIDLANELLERCYSRMRQDLPPDQFLTFPSSLMVGGVDHVWGRSPFHYTDAFYNEFLRKLGEAVTTIRSKNQHWRKMPECDMGVVSYFLGRFLPSRNRLVHNDVVPSKRYQAARVILQKGGSELEITVAATQLTRIKLEALINGSLSANSNILAILAGNELTEADLTALGYVKSAVGFYRYLKNDIQDGRLLTYLNVNENVTSLRIVLWNSEDPVVLDGVRLDSDLAILSSEAFAAEGNGDQLSMVITRESSLKANLLVKTHNCGAECIVHCDKWFSSMDAFAGRHGAAFGRRAVFVEAPGGELLPASRQLRNPAFLSIPRDIDTYLYQIGDKSRNMLHKAQRMGYEFLTEDWQKYGQDIHDIRTSDPMRQGKPIPEYFYTNPPRYVMQSSSVGCGYHTERFFGIVKDGRLVSYITLFMFGEFAQINHILCHKEHVKNGVMNLNVYHAVDELIKRCPWVRGINYLYVSEQRLGIDLFKRSMGFKSEAFLAYDSALGARDPLPPMKEDAKPKEEQSTEVSEKASTRPKKKIQKWDFVSGTVSSESLDAKIQETLGRAYIPLPAPAEAEFLRFCSEGLNELTSAHPAGACFAAPFPSRVSAERYPEVAIYLSRRFKGNPIPEEGFAMGFKGGNFRALAYFAIEDEANSFFDGRIVLEKLV